MAKIKFSAIGITNMSGKSGGSVFAFNRAGSYVRRWAKPTNPMSDLQTAVRQAFGASARAYGALTEAQRNAWKQFGIDNPRVDRLGDSRPMQAMQAFISANQNRNTIGLPAVDEPIQNAYAIPGFEISAFSIDLGGISDADIDLTGLYESPVTGLTAVVSLAVTGSASGKSYGSVVNDYGHAQAYPMATATESLNLTAQIASAGVVVGQRVFIKVELYNTAGQKSEGVTTSAVAQSL